MMQIGGNAAGSRVPNRPKLAVQAAGIIWRAYGKEVGIEDMCGLLGCRECIAGP